MATSSKPKRPRGRPRTRPIPVPKDEIPRLTEMERAFCILAEKMTVPEAAAQLGLSDKECHEMQKRGIVKRYQDAYRKSFLAELARVEVKRILKFNVTREDIVSGLYALATISPSETRGSIVGQVSAYSELATLLGMKLTPKDADGHFKGKTTEELNNFALTGSFSRPQVN